MILIVEPGFPDKVNSEDILLKGHKIGVLLIVLVRLLVLTLNKPTTFRNF